MSQDPCRQLNEQQQSAVDALLVKRDVIVNSQPGLGTDSVFHSAISQINANVLYITPKGLHQPAWVSLESIWNVESRRYTLITPEKAVKGGINYLNALGKFDIVLLDRVRLTPRLMEVLVPYMHSVQSLWIRGGDYRWTALSMQFKRDFFIVQMVAPPLVPTTRVVPPPEQESHKSASVYVGFSEGGCGDVATLTFNGYSLVPDDHLKQLQSMPEAIRSLYVMLQTMTQLTTIKYGNLDEAVNEEIERSNNLLKRMEKQYEDHLRTL